MTSVRDVMSSPVITATPRTPFAELVDLMVTHRIGALPIIGKGGDLMGIVTEADLVPKEGYGGRRRRLVDLLAQAIGGRELTAVTKSRGRQAWDIMTTVVTTVGPDHDLRAAARTMVQAGRKRVPVVEGDRVVGMLSRTDVLRALHRSDDELRSLVDALLDDPTRVPEGLDVVAGIERGIVTLRGTVQFPADRLALVNAVWRIEGVVDVVDETTSRLPEPKTWRAMT
jgi:CBS domain-containing protein